jgi:thiol:disulfide interchange protein DsbD
MKTIHQFMFFCLQLSLASQLGLPQKTWAEAAFDNNDPLLVESQLQPLNLKPGQSGTLRLKVKLPAKYHAYAEQFKLSIDEPEGFLIGPLKISPLKSWYDKFSKRERTGVENEATLDFQVEAPTHLVPEPGLAFSVKFTLTYQACTDSFCLFPTPKKLATPWTPWAVPTSNEFSLGPTLKDSVKNSVKNSIENPAEQSVEQSTTTFPLFSLEGFRRALNTSRPLAFFLAFFAGLLTSFTPCIFPMIPITLAILGSGAEGRSRRQNFILSLVYVHGIAVTYSVLGLLAVKTGSLFGSSLGNPWIVGALCLLMLAMALSLLGFFELQVPAFIRHHLGKGTKKTGYLGAFISGLFAGVVASPCVGPILVSILAYVATQGSYVLGFFLLFTYAMGMGLIFVLLGAFSELTRKLPKSGPWMERVKIFLALLMLIGLGYYLQFVLSDRWWNLTLGLGLIIFSSYYGAFNLTPTRASAWQRVRKGINLGAFVIGVLFVAEGATPGLLPWSKTANIQSLHPTTSTHPEAQWSALVYTESEFSEALKKGLPVIIDFWAEWCVACHELEEKTFSEAQVRTLSQKFVILKMDATKDSPLLRRLKLKFKIQGLPTLVFISSSGQWLEPLTLTEFEKPDKFLLRMTRALNSNP